MRLTPTNPLPIGAIMARVSLEKQAEKRYSLDMQIAQGRLANERYGLATDEQYILEDKGFSGDDWDRPAINRGITLIRTGKVKALTFLNSDRFSRDVEGGLAIIRQIRAAGGRIVFADMGEYTDDATFRLMLTIRMAIGEMEKAKIRTLSIGGTIQKILNGKAHGGQMPYGYRLVTKLEEANHPECVAGTVMPVPEELAVVVMIFEMADQGISLRQIVLKLMALKIPPPRSSWNAMTVKSILTREVYSTGIWYYNKRRGVEPQALRKPEKERHRKTTTQKLRTRDEWVRLGGSHPVQLKQVISNEQFLRVSHQLSRNRNVLGGRPSDRYLLKALVWCGRCGTRVCGESYKPKSGKTRYRCSNRERPSMKHLCGALSVVGERLERTVWDAVMETLGDERQLTAVVDAHLREQNEAVNAREVKRLERRIQDLRQSEFKARDKEIEPGVDRETARHYREKYMAMMRERQGLESEVLALVGKAKGAVNIRKIVAAIQVARRADFREGKRSTRMLILQQWIERVVYYDGEVELHLRVPVEHPAAANGGENCKREQAEVYSFALLKIKRRLAA